MSTQHSNVKISPNFNTTYRDLGYKSVGGVSVGSGSSSNSFEVKKIEGRASTTFINPNATINAVPETKGKVNVSGKLNYNPQSLQDAFKSKVGNGTPKGMGKSGWLGVLEASLGAHAQACKNGNIDMICWGKLKKEFIAADLSSDISACQIETGKTCYSKDNEVYFIESKIDSVPDSDALNAWAYSPAALRHSFGSHKLCPVNHGECVEYAGYEVSKNYNSANPLLHHYFYYSDGRSPTDSGVRKNQYVSISVPYIDKYVETEFVWCSSCSDVGQYVETFVPFTPKDLDGVEFPMESMSNDDFSFVQDDVQVESISLDPINIFTANNVVTSYDKDGNFIKTETIKESSFDIKNNNTSSPSVDTTTKTTTNTYDKDGNKTGTSTTTTTNVGGDTINNYNSEYEKSDLGCKGPNCSGNVSLPKLPSSFDSIYTSKYDDVSLFQHIVDNPINIENTKLGQMIYSFIPVTPEGKCPVWTIPNLFSNEPIDISPPCWIFSFLKTILLIGALFYARVLIMGA